MTENRTPKKIKPNNQEVTKYDFIICPNCGTEEVGKFCPNCGQSNKDFNKPIKEVMDDLLDSINLDIRLINTLIPFFTKPGFLAQEYFKGKRKKYVPPIRMYMFVSIIFFLLAQTANLDEFKDLGDANLTGMTDSLNVVINDTTEETKDSLLTLADLTPEEQAELTEVLETDSITEALQEGIDTFKSPEKVDLMYSKFLNYVSYAIFLLMPFFGGVLALTLWKSKKLYVHHLIFSVNFHSFIFGMASILIVLYKVLPENIFYYAANLFWAYPLYLMFGIKRFYERSYISAFFKTIGISLLYLFIILIVFIIVLVITASVYFGA